MQVRFILRNIYLNSFRIFTIFVMSIDLKKVPNTPGVYKFFNNHEIIYIGK